MTAFEAKRLPRSNAEPCFNRCISSGSIAGMRKSATYVAWIIDRPTYLCARCAREWSATWDVARENFSEQVAA